MPRINPIPPDQADPKAQTLLTAVQKSLGMTPNLMKTLAHSPAALGAYLDFGQKLGAGTLGGKLREQIAVVVAAVNGCEYCASAHSALAKMQGVDESELARNLDGQSQDPRTNAALKFATATVQNRGWVSDNDLAAVHEAGFTDGDVVEIVAVVAINLFSNYFNHIAQTDVDFPRVPVVKGSAPIEIPSSSLQRAINKTIFAVSTDELRPAMTGILVQLADAQVTFVATDGHRLLRYRRSVIINDVSRDKRFDPRLDKVTGFKTRSILCAPLISRGRIIGVVELLNKKKGRFSREDLASLKLLVEPGAVAIENAILYKRSTELSFTDDLTQLFNGRYLNLAPLEVVPLSRAGPGNRVRDVDCGDVVEGEVSSQHAGNIDHRCVKAKANLVGAQVAQGHVQHVHRHRRSRRAHRDLRQRRHRDRGGG